MNFKEYSKFCRETQLCHNLEYLTLGLVGEAGEIANKAKKVIRDDCGILTVDKKEAIYKEIGDVLWYLDRLAEYMNPSRGLEGAAVDNVKKLSSRKKRGKLQGSGDNR